MSTRVSVFIDYQNVHLSAHETWCDYEAPVEDCVIHPVRLAERIVEKRGDAGGLHEVHVYRGRPDPRKQPTLTGANDRQRQVWSDAGAVVHRRPLRYPADYGSDDCIDRPREKGVDVQLAVDMVRFGLRDAFDVAILVSRDTDLLPAVETLVEMDGPDIEIATWAGQSRLRMPGHDLVCHLLGSDDFDAVKDGGYYGPRKPYTGPRMKL